MATEIKPTPILYGKDAEEFHRRMEENSKRKVSQEELDKIKEMARRLRSILRKSSL